MSEEIKELKKRILTRYKTVSRVKANELVMARVPSPAIEAFKEYANNEFCGDYGMCFRDLIEKRLVIEPMMNSVMSCMKERGGGVYKN